LNTLAIIYAVNPVNEIANVNAGRLRTLGRYALGIAVGGQDQLKGKNYSPTFRAGETFRYTSKWTAGSICTGCGLLPDNQEGGSMMIFGYYLMAVLGFL